MTASREIHLVRRPKGVPVAADFAVVPVDVAATGEGEVRVQTLIMSVDPYMRPRLNADQALDAPLLGGGIGRVVQSRNAKFAEGQLVKHWAGFRETFVSNGQGLMPFERDPALSLSVYMHALGGTGITAYGGLLETGKLKDGEQVFVSTAGGAVGSVVAQIAKIKGCYVVGSTGADDKAQWLRDEAGLDAVINYKTQDLAKALEAATPKGIDVYFENVGGGASRCGAAAHECEGADSGVRDDLDLQWRRRGSERAVQHDLQAHPHGGVCRDGLRASQCGVRVRHDGVAEERTDQVSGDAP